MRFFHRLFLPFLFSLPLLAQVSGRLAGSVADEAGAPIAGATLRLYLPGGSDPVAETRSLADGYYVFSNVRPAYYDLVAEAQGRRRETIRNVKVDPAREAQVNAITMRPGEFGQTAAVAQQQQPTAPATIASSIVVAEPLRLGLGSSASLLEIADQQQGVQVDNAETASTMRPEDVRGLPALERDPLDLLRTQAGMNLVSVFGSGVHSQLITVVDGQRSSYASMTLDGINIQNQFVRVDSLGSEFNRLFLDQLSEFTVVTSNANSTLAGGSSHVVLATPSGTNQAHGSLYWYHRNNRLVANNWLDNSIGLPPSPFNQNQFGVSGAGPIRRDKLLFYANYEGFRRRSRTQVIRTLPSADIRNGIFSYYGLVNGAIGVKKVNLLQLTGATIDPSIKQLFDLLPPASAINNSIEGDSFYGPIVNTGGYTYPLRDNLDRDSVLVRLDGILTTSHTLALTFNKARDVRDDPARYEQGYAPIPTTSSNDPRTFVSAAWRWNPTSQFTNEVRFGIADRTVGLRSADPHGVPQVLFPDTTGTTLPLLTDPINHADNEIRDERVTALQSNASWTRGRHSLQFGFQAQWARSHFSDTEATDPILTLGAVSSPISNAVIPDLAPFQVDAANQWLAVLTGQVRSIEFASSLNADDSGNVAYTTSVPRIRRYRLPTYSGYVYDSWRLRPTLTLTLGLRYDLSPPVDERDSLAVAPAIEGSLASTLYSDVLLQRVGQSVGQPWYSTDKNNFAPNVGLAWNMLGNSRLVFRAGYSAYYVNDDHIRATSAVLDRNPGSILFYSGGLSSRFALSSFKGVNVPDLELPFRGSDYYNIPIANYFDIGFINPNLRTPYVQEWSAGLQGEALGMILEARYVGNHAVKSLRIRDLNQPNIQIPGYLDDFRSALSNGRLAQNAFGVFDPRYNPSIPGSRALPFFNSLPLSGDLVNSADVIRRGEAGELAALYAFTGLAPEFLPNPNYGGGVALLGNGSSSSYNALQLEATRRFRGGLQFQANYVWAKSLSDSPGLNAERNDPLIANSNPGLERTRTPFDIRHAIKFSGVWGLPFTALAPNSSGFLRRVIEGWTLSGILNIQSGTPFSIVSGRGTYNSSGYATINLLDRSQNNTAVTRLTGEELKKVVYFHFDGKGFTTIDRSAIDTSVLDPYGPGAHEVGGAAFPGEVFFNPDPGTIGTLQPRMFSGPWQSTVDLSVAKSFSITERQSLEIRAEARNATNHPNFVVFDQDINSNLFGRMASTLGDGQRQLQFGIYYRF